MWPLGHRVFMQIKYLAPPEASPTTITTFISLKSKTLNVKIINNISVFFFGL